MKHYGCMVVLFLLITAAAMAGNAYLPKDQAFTDAYTLTVGNDQKPFYLTNVALSFDTPVDFTWTVSLLRRGKTYELLSYVATNASTVSWNVVAQHGKLWIRRSDALVFSNSVSSSATITVTGELE